MKLRVSLLLTEEFLKKEYLINKKSTRVIANQYSIDRGTIKRYLKKFNINIRSISEAKINSKRSEASKLKQSLTLKKTKKYNLPKVCFGKDNLNYKHGKYYNNRCFKCNKIISAKATICISCRDFNGKNNPMFGKTVRNKYRGCYYKNLWLRSSYELAYAKYLDSNNIKWLYEPKAFDLDDSTYTPDFFLPETDEYIEVKGYWYQKSKEKFSKFLNKYKNIRISVIDKDKLLKLNILKDSKDNKQIEKNIKETNNAEQKK